MKRTILLALDTSTEFCSVALLLAADSPESAPELASPSPPDHVDGSTRIWFTHELTGPVSSTRLLPAIRELFDLAGLKLAECSAIAFGSGPGSFTGLRTATGVAQGLAFGLGVPVVPVSTLLACAEFARVADASVERVLSALDARMNEAYWADYQWDGAAGEWITLQGASLDVPEAIPMPDAPFTLAGNAAAAFGERMTVSATTGRIDHAALPHALPVALAGLRAFRAGRTVPAAQAAPDYVRNKVAQTTVERMEAKAQKAAAADQAAADQTSGQAPEPIR